MKTKELNMTVNLSGDDNNRPVLTILQGKAKDPEPLRLPIKVKIDGTLDAPADYYAKRIVAKNLATDKVRVEINYEAGTIVLIVDEDKEINQVVTGSLKFNKDFLALGINGNKTYTMATLRETLKFYGRYFESKEIHRKLLSDLVNFKTKIEIQYSQSNDFKGNAAQNFVSTVQGEIPLGFKLKMPVLIGYQEMTIDVEVCIDATSGTPEMWLESIDLKDAIEKMRVDIINTQKEKFAAIVTVITG